MIRSANRRPDPKSDTMARPPPENAVRHFCQREGVTGAVLVAVSGGPDSLALIEALRNVGPSLGITVQAVHVNHQLRGSESDSDQVFVEDYCRDRDIPLFATRLPVRQEASATGQNLEAVARRLRYRFFQEVARRIGARWVATGHQANDQAETVLHHLLRGTGLRGLRGIAPRKQLVAGIELIRPLLRVEREHIEKMLRDAGLEPRSDRSNFDRRWTRNRIRHNLLPYLEKEFNRRVVTHLGDLAEQARMWFAVVNAEIADLLRSAELPRAGDVVVLRCDRLRKEPASRIRELLRFIWDREGWPVGRMSFSAWDRLVDLIHGRVAAIDLPQGVTARRRGRVVQLKRNP